MLSQPATSIWLKTKEPTAGEWVSKFIGKVEIERLRETHFDGSRAGRNFALDRQIEPLVMESEISGLPDLHADMKYENYVTRFSFSYFDMPIVASDFDSAIPPKTISPTIPRTSERLSPSCADPNGNRSQTRPHRRRENRHGQRPRYRSRRGALRWTPTPNQASIFGDSRPPC
jgi:hypothetical protein